MLKFFSFLLPLFLYLFMQSIIAISVFLTSFSPPLSGHLLSLPVFFTMFLHYNLHFQFIHPLWSALLTPKYLLTSFFLAKPGPSSVVSLFGSCVIRASMYAEITHELSIFPLGLRDMRLFPITPSNFLQAFAPVVILIITTTKYLVDFALGN